MDRERVVERLNDLLDLETRGLAGRLNEVQPFVEWAQVRAAVVLERILADEQEHGRRLTEQIVRLGGVPRPRRLDMSSARVHYLDLGYLLPLLIDDQQQRVAACARLAAELASDPEPDSEVVEVVADVLASHQGHLSRLEALREQLAPATAEQPEVGASSNDT